MTLSADVVSQALSTMAHSALTPRQRVERVLNEILDQEQQLALPEDLLPPVQQVNGVLRAYGVEFELSEHSGRTIIRLVDRENGEVIREIPPEELITLSERLEQIRGLLIRLAV
ncbi:flagellar protein FlaG [Alcanivorax sp. S71-1-4]|uniref:flagellar protein FlaG n=1 Tax=Alcanivorax sp. S71-1-4 TaxID=1177159 RepID=UPI00135B70C8|nr:flagellar protein FlaG [Alcanivorax sp. S71-1-4]KAF0808648.1 flagellar protein FlaG [Alcanivorax sp. S71-1-4]